MPKLAILVTTVFGFCTQFTIAASLSSTELYQAGEQPVNHRTQKGIIVCRNPQVKFNEQDWLFDKSKGGTGGLLPEHMLVDTIVGKRLLHKQRSYIDALFEGQGQDQVGSALYNIRASGRRCGNNPTLILEAVYDKNQKLIRYRSRYYEDGGTPTSIDSDWVK